VPCALSLAGASPGLMSLTKQRTWPWRRDDGMTTACGWRLMLLLVALKCVAILWWCWRCHHMVACELVRTSGGRRRLPWSLRAGAGISHPGLPNTEGPDSVRQCESLDGGKPSLTGVLCPCPALSAGRAGGMNTSAQLARRCLMLRCKRQTEYTNELQI